ncbi:MAG: hypothetical protein QNJ47_12765 [Nostocaceae cyanobacterium]|nr:hypothetical protein [Nostocaceae cyanobacterium]
MANIKISELRPSGFELFQDSESFLNDMNEMDTMSIHGGEGYGFSKYLQYGIGGFAINNVVSIYSKFSRYGGYH